MAVKRGRNGCAFGVRANPEPGSEPGGAGTVPVKSRSELGSLRELPPKKHFYAVEKSGNIATLRRLVGVSARNPGSSLFYKINNL